MPHENIKRLWNSRFCQRHKGFFRLHLRILLGAILCVAVWAGSLGDGFIVSDPMPPIVVESGLIWVLAEK